MLERPTKNLYAMAALLGLAAYLAPAASAQSPVTVVVDSAPITFQQPPVEQAGRVLVPLRGVFERLGASVVYDDGLINATGNGRQISLHVGDTTATVNGRTETIDTAPFTIDGITMVPLRFVSQSLGARVRYDDSSNTVYIESRSFHRAPPQFNQMAPMMPAAPPPSSDIDLFDRVPEGSTRSSHPSISAAFSEPVDPDSVRIRLDGRDVAQDAYVSPTRFDFAAWNLPPGVHEIQVFGRTQDGAPFQRSWQFTSGDDTSENFISGVSPGPNQYAGGNFVLSGNTLPYSTVRVDVSAGASVLGGIFRVHTGTFEDTATADGNGHFRLHVHINSISGGSAGVFVETIAPSGATTVRRYSVGT